MADIRSLVSQIPMEPGYVPAPPQPDLTAIQRLMGLPQTLRAVGQNLAVGAASLPYGIYQGFGDPAAGEAAMSQFQQEYGYTPTDPAAQRQLQGLGEFLQQLETEYKIPPIMAPVAATPALGIRGMVPQTERLARELVGEIQTTPPTGAVQLAPTPGLLEKSDIGFYSQLEAAIQPLQNKGTGQQYLAQIQKSAGVKPEEIQWTGLDEFLKSKQSVTKQEIQDYLRANRVDVQEVRLDRSLPVVAAERRGAFAAYDRGEITLAQRDAILEQSEPVNTRHHLGAYRGIATEIPGGENYREILLTLPQKGRDELIAAQQNRDILVRQTADLMEEWKNLSEQMPGDPRVVELYQRLSESRKQRDRAVLDAKELQASSESQVYRSSHFDQPNILAHLRVNDRTVDGKKTLFVEEIQSDWHQAGRKRGYLTPSSRSIKDIENEASEVNRERARLINEAADLPDSRMDEFNAMNAKIQELTVRARELGDEFDAAMRPKDNVPDAPFKTSWHELSLKRAIQEASEKGYDQIAFTTGKTQAKRYNLSKQIDTLRAPYDNGEYVVSFIPKGGNEYEYFGRFTKDRLADAVGKNLAEKIIANKDVQTMTYKGDDLAIGGEGMKGFYDNILPKSLDKLGKKFGAKVGKTEMDGVEVWQMDITPQMRESVTTKGQPLFAIPAIGAGLLGAGMMQEEETY